MSIVPVSPGGIPSGFTPKSFWQRPEGGAGRGLVIAGAAGVGVALFWFWGVIVPFVLTTIANTLWLTVYGIGTFILLDVVFGLEPIGKQIKLLGKNIFQSLARAVARCYTTIDPIGILRNNLDDMKHEKATLDGTVERFSGSEEKLQRQIAAKNAEAQTAFAKAQKARQMQNGVNDPMKKQALELQAGTLEEQSGMLLQGVQQLKALEAETSKLLTTFQNWSMVADAKIARTENKVNFLAEQRSMILSAKSTLAVGQTLLRGKPEQLAMVDMALEYLEDDTAQTLGQIREFSRFTDKLVTGEQIESGANADLARQQFAEFSQKLITAGSTPTGADLIQIPGAYNSAPVAAPVFRNSGQSNEDFDPFK